MKRFKDFISVDAEQVDERRMIPPSKVTVYHGTTTKHEKDIKRNGLIDRSSNYSGTWYMVADTMKDALFHSNVDREAGEMPVVFEFEIDAENGRSLGLPYLGRPTPSGWSALRQPIPKKFIKKVHYPSYDEWLKAKGM